MGGAGRNVRSLCIGGHHLGTEHAAIVQSREVDVKQGSAIESVVAYQGWLLRGVSLVCEMTL